MKLIKAILTFPVDLIFGGIMFGLLIWYMINPEKNFTPALWLVVGYVAYNVINKAINQLKKEI